jgi:hypothetical protein
MRSTDDAGGIQLLEVFVIKALLAGSSPFRSVYEQVYQVDEKLYKTDERWLRKLQRTLLGFVKVGLRRELSDGFRYAR